MSTTGSNVGSLAQATAGALGSLVSETVVYPLDLVTTRMQTQLSNVGSTQISNRHRKKQKAGYGNLWRAMKSVHKEGGLLTFYNGFGIDCSSTLLNSFTYFFVYSGIKQQVINLRKRKLGHAAVTKDGKPIPVTMLVSTTEELLLGAVGGLVSKSLTSPLKVITVRQQTAAKSTTSDGGGKAEAGGSKSNNGGNDLDEDASYSDSPSSLEMARSIYGENGLLGFWAGFQSAAMLITHPALSFYLFELIKRAIIPSSKQKHPDAFRIFLSSAFASSIASFIVYPLILAKTRLQWKSPSGKLVYNSLADVLTQTVKQQGFSGLFDGLQGQIGKSFVSLGLTMTTKMRIENLIIFLLTAPRRK